MSIPLYLAGSETHNDMLSVPSRRECRAVRQQTSAGGDVHHLVTAPPPELE